jgi:hypothetical protein
MKDAAEIIEGVHDVVRCLTGVRPFGRIIATEGEIRPDQKNTALHGIFLRESTGVSK